MDYNTIEIYDESEVPEHQENQVQSTQPTTYDMAMNCCMYILLPIYIIGLTCISIIVIIKLFKDG